MSMHRITIADANTFITNGLTDHGSHYSIEQPATTPATVDIPLALEAATVSLDEISLRCYLDLGPAPQVPCVDAAGQPQMKPRREDYPRSLVPGPDGQQCDIENVIVLHVLDCDGRALARDVARFASRTPQTHEFKLSPSTRIVLETGCGEVVLRLEIRGALKRLARVRATVVAQLADAPKPEQRRVSR